MGRPGGVGLGQQRQFAARQAQLQLVEQPAGSGCFARNETGIDGAFQPF
jgi:hypothetical protein